MMTKLALQPRMSDRVSHIIQTETHLGNAKEIFQYYPGEMPDVLVDIGAHIGTVGLFAAVNGSRFVYCVEPEYSNFNFLLGNIIANKVEHRVSPLCMAIANKSFELRNLYVDSNNSGMRSLNAPYRDGGIQAVWTLSLEDLLRPVIQKFGKVDFLKVDVEGTEYEMFTPRDTLSDILKDVQYIDIECHERLATSQLDIKDLVPEQAPVLSDYLKSLGFTVDSYGPHYHITAKR
jgi:FkbM family methyltransferase